MARLCHNRCVKKVTWYQLELRKRFADVSTECSTHHQGGESSIQLKRWQVIFQAQVSEKKNNLFFIYAEAN